jgi:hypothetical protein
MEILKYGDFEISSDVQMTKDYYSDLLPSRTQASRNFAEYYKNINKEEKAFFENLGIDPKKIDFSGTYNKKEKTLLCTGYAYFCGEYIKSGCPGLITPERFMDDSDTLDKDNKNSFVVGSFEFAFEKEEIASACGVPEGFFAISVTSANIPWLLDEKPEREIIAYEPPKKWEIHKQLWEALKAKKDAIDNSRQSRKFIEETLKECGIEFRKMGKHEYERYCDEWVKRMTPDFADAEAVATHCLGEGGFLWHLFSYNHTYAIAGDAASREFDSTKKCKSILICNCEEKGYVLSHTYKLKAEILENFTDVTVTSANFAWTYCKTYAFDCGPYFYRPKKKSNTNDI